MPHWVRQLWHSRRFAYAIFFACFALLVLLAFTSLGDLRRARGIPPDVLPASTFDQVVDRGELIEPAWRSGFCRGLIYGVLAGAAAVSFFAFASKWQACSTCGEKIRGKYCRRCGSTAHATSG